MTMLDPATIVDQLTQGPTERLGDIEPGTGGRAGIFLLWYRDEPLFLGHSSKSANEAKPSNWGQADGVRGRLRGIRRQPTTTIQRALARAFPDDVNDPNPNADAVVDALTRRGECRYVELGSGDDVKAVLPDVQHELLRRGIIPLTLRRE